MSGLLFIVIVPRKETEVQLKKPNNTSISLESEIKGSKECKENGLNFDSNNTITKSQSTTSLRENESDSAMFKSKSENDLCDVPAPDAGCENKGYTKTSWEELKQMVRSRRKLRISTPQRGIDIVTAFHPETPLETILSEILERLKISNASWALTGDNDFWQVIFSLQSSSLCEETLQVLHSFGVGSKHQSSVCVIPCGLYYQSSEHQTFADHRGRYGSDNTAWSRFTSSVRARTNLAQVLKEVRADAVLTFDWIFLLIVAAFVAAIGLVENSTVILVASMLISPLMGPITAGTLGTAVKDRSLQHLGVQNELMGLFLSLIIGFVFGLSICAVDERYGIGDWPTYEMMSRCEIRSLWIGALVAIPSGAGVALAVLGEYTASLVGVAISASLLPPAVNAGLLWAMSLVHLIFLEDATRWTGVVKSTTYSSNPAVELAVLGTVSLCLTLVNIICIFLVGVMVYKIKEVSPLDRRAIPWWKANRSLLHYTKGSSDTKQTAPWDLYNKLNKSSDSSATADSPDASRPDVVQSDTVTYRRRREDCARWQAQNLHFQHEHIITDVYIESTPTQKPENLASNLPSLDHQSTIHSEANYDSLETKGMAFDRYGFKNTGFRGDYNKNQDCNVNDEAKYCPTIDPTSNYTVDAKLVLSSKSYNV